jgi:hypothetical protein
MPVRLRAAGEAHSLPPAIASRLKHGLTPPFNRHQISRLQSIAAIKPFA